MTLAGAFWALDFLAGRHHDALVTSPAIIANVFVNWHFFDPRQVAGYNKSRNSSTVISAWRKMLHKIGFGKSNRSWGGQSLADEVCRDDEVEHGFLFDGEPQSQRAKARATLFEVSEREGPVPSRRRELRAACL